MHTWMGSEELYLSHLLKLKQIKKEMLPCFSHLCLCGGEGLANPVKKNCLATSATGKTNA